MLINKLQIENLRILEQVALELSPGINLFVGPNGAGKTTLLEGVYLLGHGRTFRHQDASSIIRHGAEMARVVADLITGEEKPCRLGIQREPAKFIARCNGQNIQRRSDLMRNLPLQLLVPLSHDVVERSPELRRRFLDQGLFHVEHDYYGLVSDYVRALKQRNAALRMKEARLAASFNEALVLPGERITALRQKYLKNLQTAVDDLLKRFQAAFRVSLSYRQGWRKDESFAQSLAHHLNADLDRGYTRSGPHRAEMVIEVEGQSATKILSRGQQKILVYALYLAQVELLMQQGKETPVLLIDDVGAELDRKRMHAFMNWLEKSRCQTLITMLEPDISENERLAVFHVEHGHIHRA